MHFCIPDLRNRNNKIGFFSFVSIIHRSFQIQTWDYGKIEFFGDERKNNGQKRSKLNGILLLKFTHSKYMEID